MFIDSPHCVVNEHEASAYVYQSESTNLWNREDEIDESIA